MATKRKAGSAVVGNVLGNPRSPGSGGSGRSGGGGGGSGGGGDFEGSDFGAEAGSGGGGGAAAADTAGAAGNDNEDDDVFAMPKRPNLARFAKTQSWIVTAAAEDESDEQLESNCAIGQMEMDQRTLDYIWKLFRVLDQNGDGTIDASDFLAADEQSTFYSTVLRDMLEKVRPEDHGGTAGVIRKSDWISMFRNMIHETMLPQLTFPKGTQFGVAVQAMMEHANKAIRDQVRGALDYIIRRESLGAKARK
jgi:hypothetical protein